MAHHVIASSRREIPGVNDGVVPYRGDWYGSIGLRSWGWTGNTRSSISRGFNTRRECVHVRELLNEWWVAAKDRTSVLRGLRVPERHVVPHGSALTNFRQ